MMMNAILWKKEAQNQNRIEQGIQEFLIEILNTHREFLYPYPTFKIFEGLPVE